MRVFFWIIKLFSVICCFLLLLLCGFIGRRAALYPSQAIDASQVCPNSFRLSTNTVNSTDDVYGSWNYVLNGIRQVITIRPDILINNLLYAICFSFFRKISLTQIKHFFRYNQLKLKDFGPFGERV